MLHYLGLSVIHYMSFLISMLSPNNDIVFRLLVGVTSYWRFPSRVSSKVFFGKYILKGYFRQMLFRKKELTIPPGHKMHHM